MVHLHLLLDRADITLPLMGGACSILGQFTPDSTISISLLAIGLGSLIAFIWKAASEHYRVRSLEHSRERIEDRQVKLIKLVLHEREKRREQTRILTAIAAKLEIPVERPSEDKLDPALEQFNL